MLIVAVAGVTLGVLVERHRRFAEIAARHYSRSAGLGVIGVGGAHALVADRFGKPIALEDSARFEDEDRRPPQ
jgi:hypothetical protein